MKNNHIRSRLFSWVQKGAWSLADQWLFSGANFLTNILLARWLSLDEYGAFALVFSIFLFTLTIHSALLTEPMLVLGAGRLHRDFRRYLEFLLSGHIIISFAGMAFLLLIAGCFFLLNQPILFQPTLWAALGLFFLLLPWLLRRSFYVKARADLAALSSSIYLGMFVGEVLLLHQLNVLTSSSAFVAMAVASLFSCLPFLSFFLSLENVKGIPKTLRQIWGDQWTYAKWSTPSSILIWIPLNIFYLVIPYSSGLQGAATFRALSNLINPLVQSNQALAVLLLPQLSRIFIQEGKERVLRYSRALSYVFLGVSSVYLIFLLIFGKELLQFLYGDQYRGLASLLPLAGVLPIIIGLSTILGSSLRAMEQPNKVFVGYVAGAIMAATIGLFLTLSHSVAGALAGQALSYMGMVLILGYYLLRRQ